MADTSKKNGEQLLRMSPEHWIKYVLPAFVYVVLLAVSIGLFWFAGWTAYHTPWASYISFVAAFGLFLFAHHWFFSMLLGESMSHVILTNHRLVRMHENLFSSEEITEVSFQKMKTVEAHKRGFLQAVLRYGTLKFESGAKINLVPHPSSFAKDIEQAMGLR